MSQGGYCVESKCFDKFFGRALAKYTKPEMVGAM